MKIENCVERCKDCEQVEWCNRGKKDNVKKKTKRRKKESSSADVTVFTDCSAEEGTRNAERELL